MRDAFQKQLGNSPPTTVSPIFLVVSDSDPYIDLELLSHSSFPLSTSTYSLFRCLICASLHHNMFCQDRLSPFQLTAFLSICFSQSANHILLLTFKFTVKKEHDAFSKLSVLHFYSAPPLFFLLLPAIIQFSSISAHFLCAIFVLQAFR